GEAVPAPIGGVEMAPRQRVQRLDRVVADSDVEEILLDEYTDAGDVRVVRLLVQHRTAVAAEAARPTGSAGRRGEEQPGSAALSRRQGAVIAGQKAVERRVPGDNSAQKGRLRPELGLVVDEGITSSGSGSRCGDALRRLGGLSGKRISEQFHESRDLYELRRLKVK